ncbi:hypothetical protein [Erwinia aphidicola]|uniref:hypothetical protein n=1 Tax=Erwinia aphidicola TaxID=68334 RepID=UPI003CEE97D6
MDLISPECAGQRRTVNPQHIVPYVSVLLSGNARRSPDGSVVLARRRHITEDQAGKVTPAQ